MSADRPTTSFGDPNTIPPTPRDTPTSTHFPPSALETPKTNQGGFDDLSGWTPQFAEEYSVFNSTPGNLRGTSGPFPESSVSTPYQSSPGHKRLLSAGGVAVDIASHVNHYSPVAALPLSPVDPSLKLPLPPTTTRPFPSPIVADSPSDLQQRSGGKKNRRGALGRTGPQTVTPPPSARKGERRLAPKPAASSMPREEFETEFMTSAPQQQQILDGFVSAPMDMFGMPLSAPATTTGFDDTQSFWDPGMSAMDIDFPIPTADSFHGSHHKPMESIDWGKPNEIFQEPGGAVPPKGQEMLPQKTERLLAPKPAPMPNVDSTMTEAPVFAHSFHIPTDDPFATLNPVGGVDPGLLLTRPPSASIEAAFDPLAPPMPTNSLPSPQLPPASVKELKRGQVRRSASTRETGKAKKDERAPLNPPVLSSSRPGLLRSASESRARKPINRAGTLPNLLSTTRNGPPAMNGRSSSQGSRAGGRTSPLKNHQRLSSLTSIPEHSGPRTRTSVRLTIDSRGRAHTETTVIVDDEQPTPSGRRRRRDENKKEWGSSEDESSSTDDEPIIIPSRNSSFALPPSSAPSYTRPSPTSNNGFGDQETSSLGIFYSEPGSSQCDPDSDAETVTNAEMNHENRGDAMSELRKVRESRQKRAPVLDPNNHPMSSAPFSVSSPISAPPTHGGNQIRCICNTTLSRINGNGYMVQCEACEMWLHGKCIKITRQTLPRVYICAFCANTPNAQGIRGRETSRNAGGPTSRTLDSSPSVHKSVRSFR